MTSVPCCVPGCNGSRDGDPQWTRVVCDEHWLAIAEPLRTQYKETLWHVIDLAKRGTDTAAMREACGALNEAWKACVADAARRKVAA